MFASRWLSTFELLRANNQIKGLDRVVTCKKHWLISDKGAACFTPSAGSFYLLASGRAWTGKKLTKAAVSMASSLMKSLCNKKRIRAVAPPISQRQRNFCVSPVRRLYPVPVLTPCKMAYIKTCKCWQLREYVYLDLKYRREYNAVIGPNPLREPQPEIAEQVTKLHGQ